MTERQAGPVGRSAGFYNEIKTGTLALGAGDAAVALEALSSPVFEVLVQNDPGSAGNIFVGNSVGQYVVLPAGQSITIPVANLNIPFVKPTAGAGATVNYIAMA